MATNNNPVDQLTSGAEGILGTINQLLTQAENTGVTTAQAGQNTVATGLVKALQLARESIDGAVKEVRKAV